MPTRTQSRGIRAAFSVAGALIIAYGLSSGFMMIASATTNTCQQEGPSSPLAVVSEGDIVTRSLSWWPLGRACEWQRADGNGTVTTYSGSAGGTAGVYGAILIGAGLLTRGAWPPTADETPTQ